QGRAVRVRPPQRGVADLPVRRELLHGGDAFHPVRHRGRVPLSGGGHPERGALGLRAGRDRGVRLLAAARARLRLAARGPQLEVRREKLRGLAPLEGPRALDDLRVRQLRARDLLRGDLEGEELEEHVGEAVLTTRFDKLQAWGRSNSIFPLTFGLACCAI